MTSLYESAVDVHAENNTHATLVRLVGRDRAVLELGAASGFLAAVLKSRGCTVTAIDIDADMEDRLRKVADQAIIGDLNNPDVLEKLDDTFDVVLAGDVLEHLIDPLRVLRAATRLLKPGGQVVLSVPNVAHASVTLALTAGRWEYTPTGLLDRSHLRFFTYDSLLALLHEAGLVVSVIARTTTGPFETEQHLDPDEFGPDVVELQLERPESLTYQFVLAAQVRDGTPQQAERATCALEEGAKAEATARRLWVQAHRSVADSVEPSPLRLVQSYLEVAERDRDDARAECLALGQRVDLLSKEREDVRADLAELAQRVALLTKERDNASAELALVRRHVDLLSQERDDARYEAAQRNSQLEPAREQLASARATLSTAEDQLQVARQELRLAAATEVEARSRWQRLAQALHAVPGAEGVVDAGDLDTVVELIGAMTREAQELAAIRANRSFTLIQRYYRAVERVAPGGTRRRRFFLTATRARRSP